MSGSVLSGEESPRKLQELARHQCIVSLYQNILMDMKVCEVEGWDRLEFIRELQNLLNAFTSQSGELKAEEGGEEMKDMIKEYVLSVLKKVQYKPITGIQSVEVSNVSKMLMDIDDEEVVDEALNLSKAIVEGTVQEGYVKQMLPSLIEYIKEKRPEALEV